MSKIEVKTSRTITFEGESWNGHFSEKIETVVEPQSSLLFFFFFNNFFMPSLFLQFVMMLRKAQNNHLDGQQIIQGKFRKIG